jgi:hypothetical protein
MFGASPPQRVPSAEPLEGRCFLSAHAPPDAPAAGVEVLEVAVAQRDDNDVDISLSQLPPHVLAAIHGRFPGAKLVEASYSTDDGPEYSVDAEFGPHVVEITLTPAGDITEIGESVTSGQLPKAVLEWVRQDFSNAEIDEAAVVTKAAGQSYELVIATLGKEYEATVRLHNNAGDEVPRTISDPAVSRNELAAVGTSDDVIDMSPSGAADSGEPGAAAVASRAQPTDAAPSYRNAFAASVVRDNRPATLSDAIVATLGGGWTAPLRAGISAAFNGAGRVVEGALPIARLPQIADALGDVGIPLDVLALQRSLSRALDAVGTLADEVVGGGGMANVRRDAYGAAIFVALVAGSRAAMEPRRRSRRARLRAAAAASAAPVVLSDAANSSWSWVVGAPADARRPN